MQRPSVIAWGIAALTACASGQSGDANAVDETGADASGTAASVGDHEGSSAASLDGTDTNEPGACGNGVVDSPAEYCDDGPMNSDSAPDACRTDCRLPRCSDGVTDPSLGEECDDGQNNSNQPNSCRATCVLPRCGDGVADLSEACDDGNEAWGDTCYACDNYYYFILNSADLAGRGDVSIIRTTRDSDPVEIVGGDPSYNGIRQLALAPAGAALYALQSSANTHRVLSFDPVDGTLMQSVDIGASVLGYEPTPYALARASDGLLYVALAGLGITRLVAVDPGDATVVEAVNLPGVAVADMAADDTGHVFISTGAVDNSVLRVDLAGGVPTYFLTGLAAPIGLTFDPVQQQLWVANNPAGAPVQVVRASVSGVVTPYSVAGTDIAPYVRGLAIDTGQVVLATERELDRVVAVQNFDAVQDIFTDMVVAPTDIEILAMNP